MSSAAELNEADFASAIKTDVPVLVDFWAPWCGPCRMLAPVIDQVASEIGAAAKIFKVNVDDSPNLAAQFGVMNIPTLIVFKNGEPVKKMVGVQSKDAILKALA
ncbi:MAG TPA: thioredoxin [Candidatus Spyradosoma merdigallinarum]|uniref:Thioredoxin n=1 Tax=Candidatus Spyradosoma merdigallinarum TaxID=2840950 RepID=A0A9D1NIT1_9BACT|nr:thioredoxin [Candidatus Spyradosoma merdigallinarum]